MNAALQLIASVKTPVTICAVAIWALVVVYRAVLGLKIFPPLKERSAYRLLRLMVVLAFLPTVLALAAWLLHGRTAEATPVDVKERMVELRFRNAPLDEVLRSCAKQAGAELAIDSGLRANVSIETRTRLADALTGICEAHGCTWQIVPGDPPALLVRRVKGATTPPAPPTPLPSADRRP